MAPALTFQPFFVGSHESRAGDHVLRTQVQEGWEACSWKKKGERKGIKGKGKTGVGIIMQYKNKVSLLW